MKKTLISALLLFLTACTSVVSQENTFSFEEEIDGMGAWNWKGYQTLYSDSPVWRQVDHYFSFEYPAKWNLEESMSEIVISSENFQVAFSVSQPKEIFEEEPELSIVKNYCQNQINGSDQVITEERDVVLGNRNAFWISFDSTAGKEYSGHLICVDLDDSWMFIKASPLNEDYDAKFENILGSLSFTETEEVDS